MISMESVIEQRFPGITERKPLVGKTLISFMRFLCHEREFKQFEEQYPHLEGFDFIEQVFNYFDFAFRIKNSEIERIPNSGRVVIIANHPIGSLDGLALLKMVGEIRPDVKAVANEILFAIEPLRSLLLPVDNMTGKTGKDQLRAIRNHLNDEGAIIIFPAGEVSRMGPTGIKDGRWNSGFLRFATSSHSPILPIFVDGKNSIFFYSLSLLAKPISTLWLIREMFKQAKNHVDISVGHLVYPEQYQSLDIPPGAIAKRFKKHIYRLPKRNKPQVGFIPEYEAVAHPENRQRLKREIQQCELLGHTTDGKGIYLFHYQANSVIMREIGRLRELTFRAVKEGTGRRRDTDRFDCYYDHLVLWDDNDLEIAGAYRMANSGKLMAEAGGKNCLYTQTLFNFTPNFTPYLEQGLELGRSFVQPQYWGNRSLDYLWQGIGAYLKKHPDIRYLFGPVSLSHDFPEEAKEMLTSFYNLYFGSQLNLASAKNPFVNHLSVRSSPKITFNGHDYRSEFRLLKQSLSDMGQSIPTLYKQYTELCEPGGAQFVAFNVDKDFSDCVDGLIVVDLETMKPTKRNRYLGTS